MLKFKKYLISILVLMTACITLTATADKKAKLVNINTASAKMIAKNLHGIGPKTAAAIVEYRTKHGDFKRNTDLLKVKRISRKLLNKLDKKITTIRDDENIDK